ncbi:MAG: hypothetical protein ACLPSH_03760 [Vulcanimicrobiaceae bacterium]
MNQSIETPSPFRQRLEAACRSNVSSHLIGKQLGVNPATVRRLRKQLAAQGACNGTTDQRR